VVYAFNSRSGAFNLEMGCWPLNPRFPHCVVKKHLEDNERTGIGTSATGRFRAFTNSDIGFLNDQDRYGLIFEWCSDIGETHPPGSLADLLFLWGRNGAFTCECVHQSAIDGRWLAWRGKPLMQMRV
jgi:hypothetical protein